MPRLLTVAVALTVALLGVLGTTHAEAQVIVLKSRDLEQFNRAASGFTAACPGQAAEFTLSPGEGGKRDVVKRMLAARPKYVLAIGISAARLAKEEFPNVPLIFVMVPNPQKYSLTSKNIAGVALEIPVDRQFAVYKSLAPAARTVGVIYDAAKTGSIVAEGRTAAERVGLKLHAVAVSSEKQVPAALREMLGKIDGLWMVPDDTVITPESFKFLSLAAIEHNLPFLAVSDIFVEVGALASLTPDYTDLGRQACQLIGEIEAGRGTPERGYVVPPAKVNLSLNLKTAAKIGLDLTPQIVKSASKVYQ